MIGRNMKPDDAKSRIGRTVNLPTCFHFPNLVEKTADMEMPGPSREKCGLSSVIVSKNATDFTDFSFLVVLRHDNSVLFDFSVDRRPREAYFLCHS